MPTVQISPDLELFYAVDDFTDPWRTPETILMLHGNAESSAAWYAWVPLLARHYRVVRPDMRGFGASTPMPRDYPWTIERIVDDYIALMDALGIERCHLVAAKIGGTIARVFAARYPKRVATLALIGTPQPYRDGSDRLQVFTQSGVDSRIAALVEEFETKGVEHWARRMMQLRLGNDFPPEGIDWWSKYMGRTAVSSQIGFMETIAYADTRAYMPRIACPTLVITGAGSAVASVEETKTWQQSLPDSELLILPGSSYHIAVTHAERCAQETLRFIAQHRNN